MLPTCLFILHVEPADGGSSRKNLILSYWVGSLDRLPTDVHACDTIRIRSETASDTAEVSPVPAVLAADVSASWAGLACVPCRYLDERYSELDGFVGECVAEEAVGYSIRFSSTLATHFTFQSSELVEAFDGDACVVRSSEIGQLFGEEPSVCANVASLSSSEPLEFESCFSTMPILVSVLLQFRSTVFVSDLSQRDRSSKVKLLQNPASPLVHHGYSNAIGVLVYADHVVRDSLSWRSLLQQHEETVATGHQDTRGSPTITHVLQESPVCSVTLDGQAQTFIVAAHTQDWVPTSCTPPREQTLIEAYCWMLNPVCDLASLPGVPLSLFDQLACYLSAPIVSVDYVVQRRVRLWLRGLYGLEGGRRDVLERCVGFMELMLFGIGQRGKVELQYLLRRYLPVAKMFSQPFNVESYVELFRNSSPCLRQEFPCGDWRDDAEEHSCDECADQDQYEWCNTSEKSPQ